MYTRTPLIERLMAKVEPCPTTGCWLYIGCGTTHGYGLITRGGDSNVHGMYTAHHASWIVHRGEVPEGMEVCHHCDVRCCVNPAHLFLGTRKENMQDCIKKKRFHPGHVPGEKNGQARLSAIQVAEIRALYATGARQIDIAEKFSTSQTNVSRIVRNEGWKVLH